MTITPRRMAHDMTFLQLPGKAYRTGRLTALFALPLNESDAAANAILPSLLTRSCRRYPTLTALNGRLDELYGADIGGQVLRLGGWQMLRFTASFLRPAYTLQGENLAADCTRLLLDMLFDPSLDDGAFRQTDFEQEQRCLLEYLQSEINDKRLYARRQCECLLCPGQAYSVNPYGTEETVRALTPETAVDAWKRMLSCARVHWLYQGEDDPTPLIRAIEERFAALPRRQAVSVTTDTTFTLKESARTDTMDIQQAKLVLGLRIAAAEPDGPVMAARLMNTLLGGSPTSLLFRHVREEQSLCYYCSSGYDRLQGVLMIDSGIEAENAEKAKTEILRQLEAIRQGRFSDEELEAARRALIQQFTTVEETPAGQDAFYISQTLYDRYITPQETVRQIAAVTRDEVCAVAHLVHQDTTYLLCPHTEGGERV